MSKTLVTGSTVSLATAFGTSFTITGITNANPAVATLSSSHGVAVNDIIHITSCGWARLQDRTFRISAVSTNDVTLEGLNTSDTTAFPAGSGTGAGREITTWTQVPQVETVTSTGGDLNFTEATELADNEQRQVPTTRGATSIAIVAYDDPTLSGFSSIATATDARSVYPIRISFANSSKLYAAGYWNMGKTPNMQPNSLLKVNIGVTLANEATRYAS